MILRKPYAFVIKHFKLIHLICFVLVGLLIMNTLTTMTFLNELLHLIKQDDIDIFDISIDKITKQYLDYINKMEELNLNIASEYLVMASDLIELKSRTLLPHEETDFLFYS